MEKFLERVENGKVENIGIFVFCVSIPSGRVMELEVHYSNGDLKERDKMVRLYILKPGELLPYNEEYIFLVTFDVVWTKSGGTAYIRG